MPKSFKPIFTITNRITAGLTRIERARGFLEAAILRDVLIKERDLSERQAKALEHMLEHGSLTIQGFKRLCPEVNRRSLQRDLKVMVDVGLLVTEGETHHLLYRLAKPG
jgi:predicted HTH transcriptional regulator